MTYNEFIIWLQKNSANNNLFIVDVERKHKVGILSNLTDEQKIIQRNMFASKALNMMYVSSNYVSLHMNKNYLEPNSKRVHFIQLYRDNNVIFFIFYFSIVIFCFRCFCVIWPHTFSYWPPLGNNVDCFFTYPLRVDRRMS